MGTVLQRFVDRVRPLVFWKAPLCKKAAGRRNLRESIVLWVLGVITTFSGMFAVGYFLRGPRGWGILCFALSAVCFWRMIRRMEKGDGSIFFWQ